jgi:hypothetical protein
MSDIQNTVQNVSLGAATTSGLMGVITQNATAISVLCTAGFGLVYVTCAIINTRTNSASNRRKIIKEILSQLDEETKQKVKSQIN